MKRAALIILVLFCACHSDHSDVSKKEEIMFPFGKTNFSWKGIEKRNDTLKDHFMKQARVLFKSEQEMYHDKDYEPDGLQAAGFAKAFHVIDINNDGLDDLVYDGSTGGEGFEVAIVLNTGKDFKIIFKQIQHIEKLEFKDNKLFRIYLLDDGCCADYLNFNHVYEVDHKSAVPQFNLIYLTSMMTGADLPKKYFTTPIHFEVLNDGYKLREEPVIDDTSKNGVPGTEYLGNNIDTLNKGTRGRAIASKTDKTGRVWWLVEIDTTHTDHGALFYEHRGYTSRQASKMGWISSRFVKRLDE